MTRLESAGKRRSLRQRMRDRYEYHGLPLVEGEKPLKKRRGFFANLSHVEARPLAFATLAFLLFAAVVFLISYFKQVVSTPKSCDSVSRGYQCDAEISTLWGQYSPYFSVPSSISDRIPHGCSITFAQVLSRHGARHPTYSKNLAYAATVAKIHANVDSYPSKYAFLKNFEYALGADQLSVFGQNEMVNSGKKFHMRYKQMAQRYRPFVRSSGQARVVHSAVNWTSGFYASEGSKPPITRPSVIIPEGDGVNNTLSHALCTAFENGPDRAIGSHAQSIWNGIWVPPIQQRLNSDLQGANLTVTEVIHMMDLCPFITVANHLGTASDFCGLFTAAEWRQYNYYQTLGKYYGYGAGNPLGPTQGVGFVNELIARLTDSPVRDDTSTNRTLDADSSSFPIDGKHKLFAEFSHDNDMTGIFAALGLYNDTAPLSNSSVVEPTDAEGFSASWTVPFASRLYVEKMQCRQEEEELVRVIVNDRVQPLKQCGGDEWGRCKLGKYVESLGFAKQGGQWESCFA